MKYATDTNGERHEITDDNYLVNGVLVRMSLASIIQTDLESFLAIISEDAGFPCMVDQTYEVEGHEGDDLLIRVRGDVTLDLQMALDDTEGTWSCCKLPRGGPHATWCPHHNEKE